MKNFWLPAILLLMIAGCKSKRTSLADDQEVTAEEFIDFFPEIKLPFNLTDTAALFRRNNDSTLIGYKIFTQMVRDSVLARQFGSKARPRIYPIGRVPVKKGETYLFIKAIAPAKRGVYLLTFDKRDSFKAALPLLVIDNDPQTFQSAEMDNRHTITTMRQRRKPDGTNTYRKDVYVYSDPGQYTLILTESNETQTTAPDIVNPLDTFSRRHKYAADYVKDARNMVSIREGKNGSNVRFFIHFEKDKGACKGELRGEANFVQPTVAVYRQSGDPCVLQFSFTSTSVTLKELEGCGNYRDIRCFFEGSFPKKRDAKPKKK
ncbi:MAG TPA: hypothetical protein VD993_01885 [Chitinophagaceae bacterium]|nr:hypothetical protein [Chitinophagaceae bacterium]